MADYCHWVFASINWLTWHGSFFSLGLCTPLLTFLASDLNPLDVCIPLMAHLFELSIPFTDHLEWHLVSNWSKYPLIGHLVQQLVSVRS